MISFQLDRRILRLTRLLSAHLPIEMEEDGTHRIYYMGVTDRTLERETVLSSCDTDRNRFAGISLPQTEVPLCPRRHSPRVRFEFTIA